MAPPAAPPAVGADGAVVDWERSQSTLASDGAVVVEPGEAEAEVGEATIVGDSSAAEGDGAGNATEAGDATEPAAASDGAVVGPAARTGKAVQKLKTATAIDPATSLAKDGIIRGRAIPQWRWVAVRTHPDPPREYNGRGEQGAFFGIFNRRVI